MFSLQMSLIFILSILASQLSFCQSETFNIDYEIKNQLKLHTLESSFSEDDSFIDIRISNPTAWTVKEYAISVFLYSSGTLTSFESAAAESQQPGRYQEYYSFDNFPILKPESSVEVRLSIDRSGKKMPVNRVVCEFNGPLKTDKYHKRSLKVKPTELLNVTISHSSLKRLEEYRDGKLLGSMNADQFLEKMERPFFIEVTSSFNLDKPSDQYIEIRNEKNRPEPSVRYLVLKAEKNYFTSDKYQVALSNYDGTIPKSFVSGEIHYSNEYIKVIEVSLKEGKKHERVQIIYYEN
jgi:hypothetical protein